MIRKVKLGGEEKEKRNSEIKKMASEGHSIKDVALQFQLSEIYIRRIIGLMPTMEKSKDKPKVFRGVSNSFILMNRRYIAKEKENLLLAKELKLDDMVRWVEGRIQSLENIIKSELNDKESAHSELSVA